MKRSGGVKPNPPHGGGSDGDRGAAGSRAVSSHNGDAVSRAPSRRSPQAPTSTYPGNSCDSCRTSRRKRSASRPRSRCWLSTDQPACARPVGSAGRGGSDLEPIGIHPARTADDPVQRERRECLRRGDEAAKRHVAGDEASARLEPDAALPVTRRVHPHDTASNPGVGPPRPVARLAQRQRRSPPYPPLPPSHASAVPLMPVPGGCTRGRARPAS